MPTIYIGVGSNLGKREENCLNAVKAIAENGIIVKRQSSLYRSEPWGVKNQPEFINMAVEAETEKKPPELLETLKLIERQMGREDAGHWEPRIIDLDILLYDGLVIDAPGLKIPHPLMHSREFVLRPLCEISPETVHPVIKKTFRQLLTDLMVG